MLACFICVICCAQLLREREAKSHAVVLEMIGDLPDAEMAPPENVLFVCKLNPVTTDDDLEIIFTRFGPCKAEICRDHITGEAACVEGLQSSYSPTLQYRRASCRWHI